MSAYIDLTLPACSGFYTLMLMTCDFIHGCGVLGLLGQSFFTPLTGLVDYSGMDIKSIVRATSSYSNYEKSRIIEKLPRNNEKRR